MSPNRLSAEKNPYLLQHKDNPVDWYAWGVDAFQEAKTKDRPLLLSIGYSTCHWCHVMEHESFSDPIVAKVMNDHFVCVKLDREERPDVDKIYMTAVQAMTGQGGWPLNVFLTPDLKPFFGGTYFPPQARWGQPGWRQLLERIAALWSSRRSEIEADAGRLTQQVIEFVSGEKLSKHTPAMEVVDSAVEAYRKAYDASYGGFGHAPKFPMPVNQRFLLRRAARSQDAGLRSMALESLRAMTRGGIFDQIGGGIHRYSTDEQWRVPHFEKMLYDNAQFLENLAEAVLLTRDPEMKRALELTVDYLQRDLRGAEGGFFSAEDADSIPGESIISDEKNQQAPKSEGAFYLWSHSEIETHLREETVAGFGSNNLRASRISLSEA
jgi:uncharacterized protein YyaL (SSP411 family)